MTTALLAVFRFVHTWWCLELEYCRSCDAPRWEFYGPTLMLDAAAVGVALGHWLGGRP